MISIIIPSTGREQQLGDLLTVMESETPDDSEIIVVLDHGDIVEREKYDTLGRLITSHLKTRFVVTKERGCWRCKNIALESARHELIMWTADDVKPHPGWFTKGINCFNHYFPDGLGLVVFNDLHCLDQTAGHAITSRGFLRVLFGYPRFPPEFRHFFLDTLISDRAKAVGCYHFCTEAVLEHMHWRIGKSERDSTNERNEGQRSKNGDKQIKDAMDEIWLRKGGMQEAMKRLSNEHTRNS